MKLVSVDPSTLTANPWNSNVVSEVNEQKLEASIERLGNFKPVLVRELPDGSLQILGGEHRWGAELRRGTKEINVINLGVITDNQAKEISLADNERYGEDDQEALEQLLKSLSSADELHTFLPISDDEFDSFWSKENINLDDLDLDDDDLDSAVQPINTPASAPTHRVIRFKIPVADADRVTAMIEGEQKKNGFTTCDALTNAGDALINILKEIW